MRRRFTKPRTVTQSFKKVLNFAGASRAASTKIDFPMSTGVDSVAAGQTGATDGDVPTGSVIRGFEIQFVVANLVSLLVVQGISIQLTRSGQSTINPVLVGGNPQRNQVFYQNIRMLGKDQNNNYVIRFKVPKKYQRVREGDKWTFVTFADQVSSSAVQIIYKFYR